MGTNAQADTLQKITDFCAIFSLLPGAYAVVSSDSSVITSNKECNIFFNWQDTQVQGENIFSLINPHFDKETQNDVKKLFDTTRKGKKAQTIEVKACCTHQHTDSDTSCYWKITTVPLMENKKVTSTILAITDITDLVEQRRLASKGQAMFKALIEKSTDATSLINEKGKVLYTSPSMERMLEYTREDYSNLRLLDIIHPDDRYIVTRSSPVLMHAPNVSIHMEYRVRSKSGRYLWLDVIATNLLKDPNIKGIAVNFRDITDRKEAEELLQKSEQRFRLLAEAIPQIVWIAKPDGVMEYFNERWYEYTQMKKLPPEKVSWNKHLHPDDIEHTTNTWQASLLTGEPYETEYRLRQGNTGIYRWFLGRALPLRDDKGEILRWFGTCTDIDEQRKAIQQKEDFVGIASHELKTPVTSMKAYIQLLQRKFEKKGDAVTAETLGKINAQLNKLTSLIADLLDITKIDTGKLILAQEEFDIDTFVDETIENLQMTATKHKIIRKGKAHTTLFADKDRIGQVLSNLITNAIKYSPQADQIIIHTKVSNDILTMSVQDFGIGIPQEKQQDIFKRFFRVEGPKIETYPGLGLGLYISSAIITHHQGKMWVKSTQGKGSTFYVSIPIKQQHISKLTYLYSEKEDAHG